MESIREKIPIIIALIITIGIIIGTLFFFENYEKVYYTKIDNTKIETLPSNDSMKYKYILDCYSENGSKKELEFKTSRQLRENAYLMLEVRILGVNSWKEVQYNDLPEKVKSNYNE